MAGMGDPLAGEPFGWKRAGAGLQISYAGRPIQMLRGAAAALAIARLQHASPAEAQQALAQMVGSRAR
jgi:hypothetical protein